MDKVVAASVTLEDRLSLPKVGNGVGRSHIRMSVLQRVLKVAD